MRRYQKRLLIIFGSLFGTVLFFFILFNILVLNLFEGRVDSVLELVPPKEVSYVISTNELGPGLDKLPDSLFMRRMRANEGYEAFVSSEFWQSVEGQYSLAENVRRLQEMRDKLPIDVLEGVLGDDLVIAGNPSTATVNEWDFIVYSRIGKLIKIGVDFCDNPIVKGRLDSSIQLERVAGERFREVALVQDGKEHRFFFTRIKDVLVVTNKRDLMRSVMRLRAMGPNLSLAFDRTFQQAEVPEPEAPTEYSYFLNIARLWTSLEIDKRLEAPDVPGQIKFALEFFNADRLSLGAGQVDVTEAPEVRGDFMLAENAIQFQHEYRIFNTEPIDVSDAIDRFLPFVPDDCFSFVFLRCPAPDLFTLLSSQVGDKARQLVDETLAEKPVYRDFDDFLQQTAANFGDRLSIAVSRIDYGSDRPFRPLPAVTLFFEVSDHERLEKFLDYLTGDEFALSDMQSEEYLGTTLHVGQQKLPVIEWATELAYATFDDTFVLSTSYLYLRRVAEVHAKQSRSLFANPDVSALVSKLPRKANAFTYWDAESALDWLDDYKHYIAEMKSAFPDHQWVTERLKAEQRVRASNPGVSRNSTEFDVLVEEELKRVERDYEATERDRLLAKYDEYLQWARVFGGGVGSLTFGTDRIQVFGRSAFAFQE